LKQKPINPSFEPAVMLNVDNSIDDLSDIMQQLILSKILKEFEQNKIHLNSQLSILELAQITGSNRTYISNLINKKYNQNFCSFVNNYRLLELEQIYQRNPQVSDVDLSKLCGFGSVVSMRRAMSLKTGATIGKWKVEKTYIDS
jgi:AraC-like DNA-binding protein